eukprot:COSAG02_NODE_54_length_43941_cov_54.857990_48_plen_56_part_00
MTSLSTLSSSATQGCMRSAPHSKSPIVIVNVSEIWTTGTRSEKYYTSFQHTQNAA